MGWRYTIRVPVFSWRVCFGMCSHSQFWMLYCGWSLQRVSRSSAHHVQHPGYALSVLASWAKPKPGAVSHDHIGGELSAATRFQAKYGHPMGEVIKHSVQSQDNWQLVTSELNALATQHSICGSLTWICSPMASLDLLGTHNTMIAIRFWMMRFNIHELSRDY